MKVFLRDDTLRTLIWTPDASKAMALIANTPDAFNQTWYLPCDDERLTYKQLISIASDHSKNELNYTVVPKYLIRAGAIFKKQLREVLELLPRYESDNIFCSTKFKKRFPDFSVTSYREGIEQILTEQ